jgi:hypothetical protein
MNHRSTVAPATLPVELREEGVFVEYLDGREVLYRGIPEKATGSVRTQPGTLVQVLVVDPSETEGILTYINDRDSHDEVLEDSGVGRVFVEPGEQEELFPGVTATADGYAIVVDVDPSLVDGRVFVFAEDELVERSYELVE